MYISSFHIDKFGLYADVQVSGLGPGITIFYGENEAGKSTCLEFLRCTLLGYPSSQKKLYNRFKPLTGSPNGGSLTLQLGGALPSTPVVRLSRYSDNREFSLYSDTGRRLPDNLLENIFTGINRDVYIKVFGFSLGELESFETLKEKGVQEALYAASFGPGIASPAAALAKLKNEMASLFAQRGGNRPINQNFKELLELDKRIAQLRAQNDSYNALKEQLNQLNEENSALGKQKKELEREIRQLDRKLGVWRQWEQWRALKMKLAALPETTGSFPENAAARLSEIQHDKAAHESNIAAIQKKIATLEIKLGELSIDEDLLSWQLRLRQLAERKTSYRQALARISSLQAAMENSAKELRKNLNRLGPDWDCERIHATDRSIFGREGMEKAAAELNTARLERQAAATRLEQLSHDIERAESALEEAKQHLAGKPEPEAILTPAERDELRANMGNLENCERQGPARKQAFEKARAALARALLPLQIPFQNNDSVTMEEMEAIGKRLDGILAGQAKALKLAEDVTLISNETERLVAAATSAEHRASELQKELYDRQKELQANAGPNKTALENRAQALRSLRSLSGNLEKEQERLKELDERIQIEKNFSKQKNWFLIGGGIVFLLAGLAIFVLYAFFHITELAIAPQAILPINLWAAYVMMACGVFICAFGFPGNSSEQKRRKLEIAQLESRRETSAMNIAEWGNKAQQLCVAADVESMDNDVLNLLEDNLQQDKIRLAEDQRAMSELGDLKKREEEAKLNATALRETAQEKNAELQTARRAWHELMQGLETGFVPLPEQADVFFARVEGAKTACENAENAERELDALWSDYYILEKAITSLPAISQRLENAEEPLNFREAVKQALDACREADIIHEERRQLLATIGNLEKNLGQANGLHEEALRHFESCQQTWKRCAEKWNESITGLGLAADFSPETAREALAVMEAALAAENRQQEAAREYELAEKELAELRKPLAEILATLNQPVTVENQEEPDWLSLLDGLLQKVELSKSEQETARRYKAALEDEHTDLDSEEIRLSQFRAQEEALFQQANVNNADEFLRHSRLRQERREMENELANLEFMLAAAADGMELTTFLSSFEGQHLQEHEDQLENAKTELERIEKLKEETVNRAGSLQEKTEQLATETRLAAERQKEMNIQDETLALARKWSAFALASSLLNEAKGIFEKEKQPEVIRLASTIFKKITNGRWAGFGVSLEDKGILTILPPEGEPVPPEYLSRGTQEQAYLALRIGYILNRSRTSPALPVIMDEILVNFDPRRAERAARAIAELAADDNGGSQQVFYFTCQPHMIEIIKSASPQSPVYTIEKGAISRNGA